MMLCSATWGQETTSSETVTQTLSPGEALVSYLATVTQIPPPLFHPPPPQDDSICSYKYQWQGCVRPGQERKSVSQVENQGRLSQFISDSVLRDKVEPEAVFLGWSRSDSYL